MRRREGSGVCRRQGRQRRPLGTALTARCPGLGGDGAVPSLTCSPRRPPHARAAGGSWCSQLRGGGFPSCLAFPTDPAGCSEPSGPGTRRLSGSGDAWGFAALEGGRNRAQGCPTGRILPLSAPSGSGSEGLPLICLVNQRQHIDQSW